MPANVPQFHVRADNPSEVYGCDVTEIKGNQHLVVVDYKSVCIFWMWTQQCAIQYSDRCTKIYIFWHVRAPDRLVTDNAHYFVSEEFAEFTMQWNIIHLTSSVWYPQGNSHAETVIQTVKSIYEKCHDIKMELLLLKTMTIICAGHNQKASCFICSSNVNLRTNLPLSRSRTENQCEWQHDRCEDPVMTSKYRNCMTPCMV